MNLEAEIAELKQRVGQIECALGLRAASYEQIPPLIRIKAIQIEIATAHGLTLDDLLGPCREEHIIGSRHQAMYLARQVTSISLSALSKAFKRDRGTITYAILCVESRMKTNCAFADEVAHWLTIFKPNTPNENTPNHVA